MVKLEDEIIKRQDSERAKATPPLASAGVVPDGLEAIETDISGIVLKVHVSAGDAIVVDETIVCTIEAMKVEVPMKASVSGTVDHVLVLVNQQVKSGDMICTA